MRLAVAVLLLACARAAAALDAALCGLDTTGCLAQWTYLDGDERLLFKGCTEKNSAGKPWCMRPAYVKPLFPTGETTLWIYTDAPSGRTESECMQNWTYYGLGGGVIEANIKTTTTAGTSSSRPWCAQLTRPSRGHSRRGGPV
jgi:hypothetical protein